MLLFLLAISSFQLKAQSLPASAGTEFFVVLPSLGLAENAQLRLNITAVQSTNVTVTFLDVDTSITQFVETGKSWEVVVPRGRIEVIGQMETRSDRALLISSEQPVTALAVHDAEYFTDAWVLLPTSTLGLDYRVMSFGSDNDQNLNGGVAAVVATQDNTTLRITPTVTTASGNSPGFTYGIKLNRGEVWQIVPQKPERTDMSGTRLQGDKPIAVISGHRGSDIIAGIDATNPLIESIPPIRQWGKEFYAIPPPERDSGYYKIVAAQNGTMIQVNGSNLATLNAGESIRYVSSEPIAVTASGPILLSEFTRHQNIDTAGRSADPSMTLIQPVSRWGRSYLWRTPDLAPRTWPFPSDPQAVVPFTHYLLITTSAAASEPILLDGMNIAPNLTTLHADGKHRSGIIRTDTGTHSLTASTPLSAQLIGYSHFDAYALPAGYAIPLPVEAEPIFITSCAPTFDTTMLIRSMGVEEVRVDRATFVGITGSIISPSLPIDLGAFADQGINVRFDLPSSGEINGKIVLHLAGDTLQDVEIPVRLQRDSLDAQILEPEISFPDATQGTPLRDSTITLVNTGKKRLTIIGAQVAPPFEVTGPSLPATLEPGDTLRINVRFAPGTPGNFQEELELTTGPCDLPLSITLQGKRTDPAVIETRVEDGIVLLCPDEVPGQIWISLYNRGGETISLNGGDVEGDNLNDFDLPDDPAGVNILPGDSVRLKVLFTPTDTGVRNARVRILHNTTPGFTLIEINARKDSAGIEITEERVDFGSQLSCAAPASRIVHLHNTGTVPITIDSIAFKGSGAYTTETPSGFTLAAGDSGEIAVTFTPPTSGIANDSLLVYGSPCGLQRAIFIRGEGIHPSLFIETDTLDFGLHPACLLPDTLIARLLNDGGTSDTIISVEITGAGFRVVENFDSTIRSGERGFLSIIFDATEPGEYRAEAVIRVLPCDIERRVVLIGKISTLSIESSIAQIEINNVRPGVPKRGSTTIRNNGDSPIVLDSLSIATHVPGLRILAPSFPVSIEPGDSIEVTFEYQSDVPATFATNVILFTSPCPIPTSFVVHGNGGPVQLQLIFPDTAANVDANIGLPVRILNEDNFGGTIHLVAEVRWNLRNLFLKNIRSGLEGTMQLLSDSIAADERIVRFSYDGTIPSDGVLGTLDALVLLGLTDTTGLDGTVIEVDFPSSETEFELSVRDGFFRTLGICLVGGARYIRFQGTLHAEKPRPNPAENAVTIPFTTDLSGSAELTIYNATGAVVAQKREEFVESGLNELMIDISSLPAAAYIYKLRVADQELYDVLIVRR